jgi:hypothetical protein
VFKLIDSAAAKPGFGELTPPLGTTNYNIYHFEDKYFKKTKMMVV